MPRMGACMLALLLGMQPGMRAAHAGLHVEIEGVRLPVQMDGELAFVALGGFAAARFLEYEYSYIENEYVLRSPQPGGKVQVLRFRPGDVRVRVDDAERQLRAAPVEGRDGLLVPLHDFVALVLGPTRAAAIQLRPDEGPAARLLSVTALARKGYTKLLFAWEGEPQPRLRRLPERGEVEVIFAGSILGEVGTAHRIDSPEVRAVHLSEDPELLQVRAAVTLATPAAAEGFFLSSSHQYVLTLRADRGGGDLTYELPETVSPEVRAFLGTQKLGIDASHGGGDRGATAGEDRDEANLALAIAKDLQALCEATGLPTEMVRADDRLLPIHTRVHHLNGAGLTAVLSLHARSQQPEQASTSPVLFLLPVPEPPGPLASVPWLGATSASAPTTSGQAADTPAPATLPDLEALRSPDARERTEARELAGHLAQSFRDRLGASPPRLEDPTLLPLSRVLAPGVAIDVGPLEAFLGPKDADFERDTARHRLAFACYQGVLDYFQSLGRRSPPPVLQPSVPELLSPSLEGLRRNILGSPEYVDDPNRAPR